MLRMLSSIKRRFQRAIDTRRGWFWYLGHRVHFAKGSILYNSFREQGSFEPQVRRALTSFARENSYVLDVGANIGLMTIPLLLRHPTVRVISVEAGPTVFTCLSKTRSLFPAGDRWMLVNKAAMEKPGEVIFHECVDGNDALSGIIDTKRGGQTRSLSILGVTLDSLWIDAGCPDVSVIKIDVEGAELAVLRGAQACIATTRPIVILEWWPDNFKVYGCIASELLDFSKASGYRIFDISGLSEVTDLPKMKMHQTFGVADYILLPLEYGTSQPGILSADGNENALSLEGTDNS